MIKKRKADGNPCPKCNQVEEQLKERALWDRIDRVIWALETDPESEGMVLARKHDVAVAPFFIVEEGSESRVYKSSMAFIKKELDPSVRRRSAREIKAASAESAASKAESVDLRDLSLELADKSPQAIVDRALEIYGADCALSFSGAEDVALIEMALRSGRPFSVFSLDTGRLHPETYRFLQRVRDHYGIAIKVASPDREELEAFVEEKGLFSFLEDGHKECCKIRKVNPLIRTLSGYRAWITGQRRDQNPSTRGDLEKVLSDSFPGKNGQPLVKFNPLADWSQQQVWSFIKSNNVPYNELHDKGYVSLGCEPCTRPQQPGEHERASRWWWEEATKRECGLHIK